MKLLGDEKELHQKTKSICAFPTPHPLLNNKEINEFIKKIIQEKGKYGENYHFTSKYLDAYSFLHVAVVFHIYFPMVYFIWVLFVYIEYIDILNGLGFICTLNFYHIFFIYMLFTFQSTAHPEYFIN